MPFSFVDYIMDYRHHPLNHEKNMKRTYLTIQLDSNVQGSELRFV